MKAIKVVITLNSPLLIARPENGDENSRTSLDYIPGSTIKGVVIKHYLQQKQTSITDDAMQKADSDIRKFFFSNQLQFLKWVFVFRSIL
jgi:RAMP superfamily.